MEGAAESVVSAYVEVGDSVGIGDRFGGCAQWRGLFHGLMGPVPVVVCLEFVQGVP